MTRIALLTLYGSFIITAAITAVLTYWAGAYLWSAVAILWLEQNLQGWQLVRHSSRLDRVDDVIGAWRRQDPEAWRRP